MAGLPAAMTPIAKKLLRWYAAQTRSLPWRARPRPYAVWVAEIMAQQTRLETMLPYYRRWMRRFSSLRSLARAKEQEVLALWEGLGYYSRARNLLRAAKVVSEQHGGRLPRTAAELRSLPGIGAYTAGAIASLAFGADEPAVDGNAIRVLARVFDVKLPAGTSAAQTEFWRLAAAHLPAGQAAAYNQALMDLGAQVCTPRRPLCASCPLRTECRAFALNLQAVRPLKSANKIPPLRHFAAAVIQQRGKVLVLQRPPAGLLAGMWEFPNAAVSSPNVAKRGLRRALANRLGLDVELTQRLNEYQHAYSHFSVRMQVFSAGTKGHRPKVQPFQKHSWVPICQLSRLPMGKVDRRIASGLLEGIE